jgi:signal transduction histidine kinase
VAAVRGAAQALRAGEELGPADRERLLGVIAAAAEQLARLADDLLSASRLDAERLEVSLAPCDAAAVAREVADAARLSSPAATIRLEGPRTLPLALADAGRLRQVLANLVDNAVVHGGGTVEISVGATQRQVTISVRDEGPGIPPAEQERIFEPFHRLGGSGVAGTGLGLYLVRGFVAAMGGSLTVASAPGRGATFTVTLPLA